MAEIQKVFALCKAQNRPALVTYITGGFPSRAETCDVMLGLQTGGADIIELGVPFTDPIADGPTIQKANSEALRQHITMDDCLSMVKCAREKGLHVPVLLMGYYNPLLSYGEDKILRAARSSGISGFILVDLPPEEAFNFRQNCRKEGLSYVPLIAPATSDARMQVLCQIADSFIYVVSRMGVTGISGSLNEGLPNLMDRVHRYSGNVPAVVGFGISKRDEYLNIGKFANGVVIGSQIIKILAEAPIGKGSALVTEYCLSITGKEPRRVDQKQLWGNKLEDLAELKGPANIHNVIDNSRNMSGSRNSEMEVNKTCVDSIAASITSRFGEFGGQYVPESLMDCLTELEAGFHQAINDPVFWRDYQSYYPYIGRPSTLHPADRLSSENGGARMWLKREDLNHTGSHKINNALGQILLAQRLGKKDIIAETGAGQHGVATATVCAKFGLKCTIYMGAEDIRRQSLNVFRIKLLGAEVVSVDNGTRTLRDAVNEALRSWVTNLSTTHYIIGSAIGPHPFPTIVRTFQSVIGNETKRQFRDVVGKNPDVVVACVGGGSNAAGMFYPFSEDLEVKLVGIEAGGDGLKGGKHAAPLSKGTKGVLHGVRTYVLQDTHGQILDTGSVSAGLDYPGVGPELSSWKDSNRVEFKVATDVEALAGFKALSQHEGIIPALETAHAIHGAMELARNLKKDQNVVICLSGRGDKDIASVAEQLPILGPKINWKLRRLKAID